MWVSFYSSGRVALDVARPAAQHPGTIWSFLCSLISAIETRRESALENLALVSDPFVARDGHAGAPPGRVAGDGESDSRGSPSLLHSPRRLISRHFYLRTTRSSSDGVSETAIKVPPTAAEVIVAVRRAPGGAKVTRSSL